MLRVWQQLASIVGYTSDMAMGWVHPWVGLGWVGFSCQKMITFFTTLIIPLRSRKSLTVIYHHSLHHEFFPQLPSGVAFYILIGF